MRVLRRFLSIAALLSTTNVALAQEEEFTYEHFHMDSSMHCALSEGDGSFTIFNGKTAIIEVQDASFIGYEDADSIDGRPINGYVVGHYPNLFRDAVGSDIWDRSNVQVLSLIHI